MKNLIFIILNFITLNVVNGSLKLEPPRNAFDVDLYENALDEELCNAQLRYIAMNNSLLLTFLDAGIRIPRGILNGNFIDMGNYHQCLGILEDFEPSPIEGKYCMINVPTTQDTGMPITTEWAEKWPEFPWPELLPNTKQNRNMMRNVQQVQTKMERFNHVFKIDADFMRVAEDNARASLSFKLAVCVPKACTTKQTIDFLLVNTTAAGFEFEEEFCRLKNDKPFVPGDYAAMVIFGLIILITIISTSYELYYSVLRKEPKNVSTLSKSFSVYTNTRSVLHFSSPPGSLECMDGIRALAMVWVIVLHSYTTHMSTPLYNRIDFLTWMTSINALWITSGAATVDTFFLLSGLLIVYTSVGKLNGTRLLKSLHLFYLNRLLRMFPILATCVFLMATLFNHVSDGPEWYTIANKVHRCRAGWWTTLIYIQNYANSNLCVGPSWYLAIDVQLHILSPLILFWVLGSRRSAWTALTLATIATLTAATTYSYINQFVSSSLALGHSDEEMLRYTRNYYMNTLTRCTPFFVGMLFGYLLNIYKGKKVIISKTLITICWVCTFIVLSSIIYAHYPIIQMDWDNTFLDGMMNSFSRPAWAACLGWIIFACTHGYGGPVNWFLSLSLWKLPARLSFAMYLLHYPLIMIVNASAVAPGYFSPLGYLFRFLADFSVAIIVGFIVTVLVESPFATLVKLAMGGGLKKKPHEKPKIKQEVEAL